MRESDRSRQPAAGGDEGGGAPGEQGRGDDSAPEGSDPLREGPESSVPWGRDRQ
jgi:hypothetical protein